MCEKVRKLYDIFKSIKNKEKILSKEQYLIEMKAFKRQWIVVAMDLDSCSEELNKVGSEMMLVIGLN